MGFAAPDRHDAAHTSNVRRSHLSFWPAALEDVGDFIQQGVMAAGDHQRPANVIQTADQLDVYQIAGFIAFGILGDVNDPICLYKGADHTGSAVEGHGYQSAIHFANPGTNKFKIFEG